MGVDRNVTPEQSVSSAQSWLKKLLVIDNLDDESDGCLATQVPQRRYDNCSAELSEAINSMYR